MAEINRAVDFRFLERRTLKELFGAAEVRRAAFARELQRLRAFGHPERADADCRRADISLCKALSIGIADRHLLADHRSAEHGVKANAVLLFLIGELHFQIGEGEVCAGSLLEERLGGANLLSRECSAVLNFNEGVVLKLSILECLRNLVVGEGLRVPKHKRAAINGEAALIRNGELRFLAEAELARDGHLCAFVDREYLPNAKCGVLGDVGFALLGDHKRIDLVGALLNIQL